MKNWIAPLLAAGTIAMACYPAMAGACESDKTKLTVEVTIGADGKPDVSIDPIRACAGDEIKWKFKGEGAREFAVEFASEKDSPFDWKKDSPFDWKKGVKREKVGKTLKGTVRADAAPRKYKYTARVDEKFSDPIIIIDP